MSIFHSWLAGAASSAIVLGLSLLGSSSAQAAQFGFSYAREGIQASGVLTTSDLDPITNAYTITGITGQRNGATITGLIDKQAPGLEYSNHPYFYYDNILYNNSTLFDQGGMLFTVEGLNSPVNVFFDSKTGQFMDDVRTNVFHWDGQRYTYYDRLPIAFKLEAITPSLPEFPLEDTSTSSAVPEPSEVAGSLLAVGLVIGAGWLRRRSRSRSVNEISMLVSES